MSRQFDRVGPNGVASGTDSLTIRRVGITAHFDGEDYDIDSQMLAAPMSIIVYFSTNSSLTGPQGADVTQFVLDALEFRGFTVERA